MNLFTSRLDAERLARATDPSQRAADRASLLRLVRSEAIEDSLGGRYTIAFAGSETPRERVWLQMDAIGDDVPAELMAWAAIESLTSERAAQHRAAVVGRARVAVVFADRALAPREPADVPFLDAASLGVWTPLFEAMRNFAPSLVIHVQDWSRDSSIALGWRLLESFRMDPAVHGALPRAGRGRRFTAARRAHGRAAAGTDWIVGARTVEYVRALGHIVRDFSTEVSGARSESEQTVISLGAARYAPSLPFRRLGGGNLGELALATTGAHAITVQLRGGGAIERAALALAITEGAIVHRMGLAREEQNG